MSEDYTLHHGDCLEELRAMPDASVDAVVTDPPYGLSNTNPRRVAEAVGRWASGDTEYVPAGRGFMGAAWDSFVPPPAVWAECLRVLKPGGHLVVFAGSRTQDIMGLSVRLAGFDVRDSMAWIFGSGFPKGQNIGKAIDKKLGAEREVVGTYMGASNIGKKADGKWGYEPGQGSNAGADRSVPITAPATEEARQWEGWNTQLKPAQEPIVVARKPFTGPLVDNVMEHGTGALNIDATRVPLVPGDKPASPSMSGGRWPANVVMDEQESRHLEEQVPGVSRFFHAFRYENKVPTGKRPEITRDDGAKVQHPTVKPVALMEWLVALVTPPGGVVLDPFAGSGTTLQAARNLGMQPVGVEQSADYCALIRERMD